MNKIIFFILTVITCKTVFAQQDFLAQQKRYSRVRTSLVENQELTDFWTNLKTGYDKFFSEKKALKVLIDKSGNYLF